MTLSERFWAKVDKSGDCWVWTGNRNQWGYGRFQPEGRQGRRVATHRLAYEDAMGAIPDGLVIDHLCRNTSCVNPDHMEAVTQRENVLRGEGVTAVNADKTTCPKGHPFDSVKANGQRRCLTCDSEQARRRYGADPEKTRRRVRDNYWRDKAAKEAERE